MIANKSSEVSANQWPTVDQSFFGNDWQSADYQLSYLSSQTPQLAANEDQWLQDFEVFGGLEEALGLGFNNEPEVSLEAMAKESDTHRPLKAHQFVDYLDSSAFLSPESLSPMSPEVNDFEPLDFAAQDLNSTSAMTILEEILSSANSTDSEDCFDSELDLQAITEISKELAVEESAPKRRSAKRKADSADIPAVKAVANKRRKSTVTEKKERKRSQNKSAANRYRTKKKAELESIEELSDTYVKTNSELMAQLQKLQMEFKVVLPLAKAAFAADLHKALQLQMLDIRVLNDNLLD